MNSVSLWQISSSQLEEIRLHMLKFAQLQLKNYDLAEDMVQEAFLNAYKYAEQFKGEAALKTWIFAILKNKILDFIRKKQKELHFYELNDDDRDLSDKLFKSDGEWDQTLYLSKHWQHTDSAVYSDQFWQVFELCLNHLPSKQAQVFMMRSLLEMQTEEICQECHISTANLHTQLYRARLQLQVCLSQKWFGENNVKM